MSSAAATRTSTGNMTGADSLGTAARSEARTSSRDSRGTAYSDSTKRTRRGVTNTSCDTAVYVRADSAPEDSRFSGGISAGTIRPVRHKAPNAVFSITENSHQRRHPGIAGGTSAESAKRLFRFTSALRPYGNQ